MLVFAVAFSVAAVATHASDKALIDALVKKGVLSSKEGEEVAAEMNKENANAPASKLKLADQVQQLKIYGETRLRYQYDQQAIRNTANDEQLQYRMRVKIKLFADYTLNDNLSCGLGVMSGTGNTSNSATFDNAFTPTAVGWSRAWLKWSKAFDQDWLEFTLGKQALGQKLSAYSFSPDTNPEGILMKLGKFDIDKEFSVCTTHGLYFYDDTREDNFLAATNANEGDDTLMLVNQISFTYVPNKDWKWEVTPGFVCYSSSDAAVAPTGKIGAGVRPQDLDVLMISGAMWHPIDGRIKGNLYSEYGVNLTGEGRGNALAPNSDDGENQFFMVGYAIGNDMTKKGDWQVACDYTYYETFSWDVNIIDSNWNNDLLNAHGYNMRAGYNFTDYVSLWANWRQAWMIDGGAPAITGLTQIAAAQFQSRSDLFYMDLIWKF